MISGDQLRTARTRAGLTQEDLAQRVGVTLRSVGNWERGDGVPRGKDAVVRDVLGAYLNGPADVSNPLASASDMALLAELGRRLDRRGGTNAEPAAPEEITKDASASGTTLTVVPDQADEDDLDVPDAARTSKHKDAEGSV